MEKNRKNRRKLNSRFLALLLSFVMVAATLYGDYSIASADEANPAVSEQVQDTSSDSGKTSDTGAQSGASSETQQAVSAATTAPSAANTDSSAAAVTGSSAASDSSAAVAASDSSAVAASDSSAAAKSTVSTETASTETASTETASTETASTETETATQASYKINYEINPANAVSVAGNTEAEANTDVTFTVKPNTGYQVSSVECKNGTETIEKNGDSYTLKNISSDVDIVINAAAVINYPAFSKTVTLNGMTITVTAEEGVIPQGTTLDAKEVTSQVATDVTNDIQADGQTKVTSVIAYDINLIDKDGNKLPNEAWSNNGKVHVDFSGSRVSQTAENAENLSVRHISSDGKVEEQNQTVKTVSANPVSSIGFDASHFSIYAILGTTPDPNTRATYSFYNGTTLVNTQIVKNGESLVAPSVPASNGENDKFVGWSATKSAADLFNFATPISVTQNSDVSLYAVYQTVYHVYFYQSNDANASVLSMSDVTSGANFTIPSSVTASVPVAASQVCTGWTTVKNDTTNVVTSINNVTKDVSLYPVISSVKWINFESNGGSYIAPMYAISAFTFVMPSNPTKAGYDFAGWYTDNTYKTSFNISSVLSSGATSATAFAKWTSKAVSYTVIRWTENADDTNYSFYDSTANTGKSGQTTAVTAINLDGFMASQITQQTIAGDGSTIVNVYYARNTYTIHFNKETSSWFSTSWKPISELTITAKYGANIQNQWPSIKYPNKYSAIWYIDKNENTWQASIMQMPIGGTDFYQNTLNGDSTYKINHYLETLQGISGVSGYGDKTYGSAPITETFNGDNISSTPEDHYAITGFTYLNNVTYRNNHADFISDDYWGTNQHINFYYSRNSYNIRFYDNGTLLTTIQKQYQADISKVTCSLQSRAGYTFGGWYDNALGQGTAYNFTSKTMPANDITLYAKWVPVTYNVSFNWNNGSNPTTVSQTIISGSKAVQPATLTRDGYSFAGWYNEAAPYNFDTQVYQNYSLTAKWYSTATFQVTYNVGTNGTSAAPVDSKVYKDGASAKVLTAVSPKLGFYFTGWKLNNAIYAPGSTFVINSADAVNNIITLNAVYSIAPIQASITYDPNTGTGAQYTKQYPNNSEITVLNNTDLNYLKQGYKFVGWNTAANGSGTSYAVGNNIGIDVKDPVPNVLYAQWKQIHTVSYSWNGAPSVVSLPSGTGNLISGEKYTVNTTYTKGYAIQSYDSYKNINGNWVFSGWTPSGEITIGDSNISITGSWSYASVAVTTHKVNYSWNFIGTPAAGGSAFNQTSPSNLEGLVKNQPYTVDNKFTSATEVNHTNQYGNIDGHWSFSGWNITGDQVMKDTDMTILGTWTYTDTSNQIVKHKVSYSWTGEPTGIYLQTIPTDNKSYELNQTYTVDKLFTNATTVAHLDQYGNQDGQWTFSGWTVPADQKMGITDVTITGSWTYTSTTVGMHAVTYSWSLNGTPAAGGSDFNPTKPTDLGNLVKNQPYSVDNTFTSTTEVAHTNQYGNIDGYWNFSGWTLNGSILTGNQKMGDADVTLAGTWIYTDASDKIAKHKVTYSWTSAPADDSYGKYAQTLPIDANSYELDQPYVVDTTFTDATTVPHLDQYGHQDGHWTFSGWTKKANIVKALVSLLAGPSILMGSNDVEYVGNWKYSNDSYRVTGSFDNPMVTGQGSISNTGVEYLAAGADGEMTFIPATGATITGVLVNNSSIDFTLQPDGSYIYHISGIDKVTSIVVKEKMNVSLTASSGAATATGSAIGISGFDKSTAANFDLSTLTIDSNLSANVSATSVGTYANTFKYNGTEIATKTATFDQASLLYNGKDVKDYIILTLVPGSFTISAQVSSSSTTTTNTTTTTTSNASSAVLGAKRGVEATTNNSAADKGEVLGATRSPKTGDDSKALLWVLVMGASSVGVAAMLAKKKKEKKSGSGE